MTLTDNTGFAPLQIYFVPAEWVGTEWRLVRRRGRKVGVRGSKSGRLVAADRALAHPEAAARALGGARLHRGFRRLFCASVRRPAQRPRGDAPRDRAERHRGAHAGAAAARRHAPVGGPRGQRPRRARALRGRPGRAAAGPPPRSGGFGGLPQRRGGQLPPPLRTALRIRARPRDDPRPDRRAHSLGEPCQKPARPRSRLGRRARRGRRSTSRRRLQGPRGEVRRALGRHRPLPQRLLPDARRAPPGAPGARARGRHRARLEPPPARGRARRGAAPESRLLRPGLAGGLQRRGGRAGRRAERAGVRPRGLDRRGDGAGAPRAVGLLPPLVGARRRARLFGRGLRADLRAGRPAHRPSQRQHRLPRIDRPRQRHQRRHHRGGPLPRGAQGRRPDRGGHPHRLGADDAGDVRRRVRGRARLSLARLHRLPRLQPVRRDRRDRHGAVLGLRVLVVAAAPLRPRRGAPDRSALPRAGGRVRLARALHRGQGLVLVGVD